MLLLIIIPTAWLTIALLVLVACRAAARGDRALAAQSSQPHIRERVVVHQRIRWQDASPLGGTRLATVASSPRGRRRARGTRCATRS